MSNPFAKSIVVVPVLALVAIAVMHQVMPNVPLAGPLRVMPVSEEPAATAKREAKELAAKAEEAKCAADLQCTANKKMINASFKCAPLIERLAENNFEWTDKWYEPKLSHFRWKDRTAQVVTYSGDKIKFQNGFGAWVLSKYECDYNVALDAALDVRASAGRLPLN